MTSEELQATQRAQLEAYAETVRRDPRGTIVPGQTHLGATARRALAVLEQLEPAHGAGNEQRFVALDTIGSGGMAVVQRATQVVMGRTVAIKTLKPQRRSQENKLELLHEAWITGSLAHPNVVPVHDIGLDREGHPHIVLEYIQGVVWSQLMRDADAVRERFGAEDLLEWNLNVLMQVLNAVHFAHSRGIVHRDLKPDNVMLGAFGEVYVVDWGLAVSLRDDGTGRLPLARDATEMAGTPCYLAPEMLGGVGQAITERTDIYLVGAILHELLTGAPPHLGPDISAVVASVTASRPRFPDDVPPVLADICQRAMAAQQDERYRDAEQLRRAIQAFLHHRGSAQLAGRALAALDELERALAGPPEHGVDHRQQLYRLFGACRFGFREALAAWDDNRQAAAGLQRATVAMIHFELDRGDERTASALCAELLDPPAELVDRLAAARRRAEAQDRRMARLEDLDRQLDRKTGRHIRILAAIGLGLVFIAVSIGLIVHGREGLTSHTALLVWNGIYYVPAIIAGYLARASLRASAINRRLYAYCMLMLIAQTLLELGSWRAGYSPLQSLHLHLFSWMVFSFAACATIDARLLPTALSYAVCFLLMAERPALWPWFITAPHSLFIINVMVVWRPSLTTSATTNE